MFDFVGGRWLRPEGVLIEVVEGPSGPGAPRRLDWDRAGIPLVRRSDGSFVQVRKGGVLGLGGHRFSPGDDLVLVLPGQFEIPLEVGPVSADQNRRAVLHCILVTEVADPIAFARVVEMDDRMLTAGDLGERLGRRRAVRHLVERALCAHDRESFERVLFSGLPNALAAVGLRFHAAPRDLQLVQLVGSATLVPGQTIGNWRRREHIGGGAFGQVWLVENTGMPGMLRAMKLVHHPGLVDLLVREARKAVEAENHGMDFQYVARLFDFVPGDAPALLYEFVDGTDLGEYVADHEGRLGLAEAILVVTKVLRGLDAIHGAGLVHRDLHPGNIRLVHGRLEDGLKILDLGLARSISGGPTTTGAAIEPAHPFAEPSALRGGEPPDCLTDLYSAGVLLWWLLTGEAPPPAAQRLEDVWPEGPAQVLAVIRHATNRNRARRYASAAELREAFDRALLPPKLIVDPPPEVIVSRASRGSHEWTVKRGNETVGTLDNGAPGGYWRTSATPGDVYFWNRKEATRALLSVVDTGTLDPAIDTYRHLGGEKYQRVRGTGSGGTGASGGQPRPPANLPGTAAPVPPPWAGKRGRDRMVAVTVELAQVVIRESAIGGRSARHYLDQADWERTTRNRLEGVVAKISESRRPDGRLDPSLASELEDQLQQISAYYHAHVAADARPHIVAAVWEAIEAAGWWTGTSPMILTASEPEARAIASVVQGAIARSHEKIVAAQKEGATIKPKRYYSAITKLLHFCFPGTFAIYDSQIAQSIQTWAKESHEDVSGWRRFDWDHTYPTDGSGYAAVIDFYREFWKAITPEQRAALSENARRMAAEIGVKPGRFNKVDLIDCHLWISTGDIFPSSSQRRVRP